MLGFMGSEGIEIDGSEALKNRRGSSKHGWLLLLLLLLLRLSVFLIRLLLLFLVGQRGSEGNGANHEIEEDEEHCGREPTIHGFPDRRGHGGYILFKHFVRVLERQRERETVQEI